MIRQKQAGSTLIKPVAHARAFASYSRWISSTCPVSHIFSSSLGHADDEDDDDDDDEEEERGIRQIVGTVAGSHAEVESLDIFAKDSTQPNRQVVLRY